MRLALLEHGPLLLLLLLLARIPHHHHHRPAALLLLGSIRVLLSTLSRRPDEVVDHLAGKVQHLGSLASSSLSLIPSDM